MSGASTEGQMALFENPEEQQKKIKKKNESKTSSGDVRGAKKSSTEVKKSKTEKVTNKAAAATGKRSVAPSRPQGSSGLVPEGDVRLTANMREDLHLKLKIAAAQQRTTIGEILEALVEKYVK
ncbi:MAG: hypothetical protein ED859_09735 [Desulfuromonadales bacterium]|nr:MAG: hypothetical protein ED859_09735 [Desulfuromonadales bacterium]